MDENKIELQIVEKIKDVVSSEGSNISDQAIKELIKQEIIDSKYIGLDDWQLDYAVGRIYTTIKHDLLYKTDIVKDYKQISIETADQKAKSALNYVYISIAVIIFGSVALNSIFVTPIIFGLLAFYFVNSLANKSLNNCTSMPEIALRAKKIAKILLIISICISVIQFIVALS